MYKLIMSFLKKIIVSVLFLYAYNKLTLPLNIVIPINIFTVCFVSLCGIPSILMLVFFSLVFI